jgi:hypothetical protein
MHDKTHPSFVPPENENARIWRYMDYPKFISLLDKRGLFFAKVMAFADPYEGTIPKHNQTESHHEDGNIPLHDVVEAELKRRRPIALINSWHINEYESAAMWDLYSKRNAGIAIQSTYRRLSKSLDTNNEDTVYIGKVAYIDFDSEWIGAENIYQPFLTKRKSFEHEQELRAITDLPSSDPGYIVNGRGFSVGQSFVAPDRKPINRSTPTVLGKYVSVDLEVLIERIHVAPQAPDYLYEGITSVAEKFGVDKMHFLKSDLYSLK